MRRLLALLLLAAAGTACTSARTPFSDGANLGQTIEVEVRNQNFNSASLWAVRSGERIRIGIVEGKQDRTFRIPWRSPSPLQIEVALQSGERCMTRAIPVDPGASLTMRVASDFENDPECT